MPLFKVSLDPNRIVVTRGQWPQTVIGNGIECKADSADLALSEVADEHGISLNVLTVESVPLLPLHLKILTPANYRERIGPMASGGGGQAH